jgi:hypothetical protein
MSNVEKGRDWRSKIKYYFVFITTPSGGHLIGYRRNDEHN